MGINGLWEILGEGDVCSLPDFAARHFLQHGRPLRIAVDAACWRFTNLTPEQVVRIREGEPCANPVEKVILWRILRLLRLNVQLLFVDDGPRRPWKRNKRGGNRVDHELTRLSHKLFDHLCIPYHQAPGEAEAECARLQALGVVDAVWSDDGDALMFGCGTLIRQHKVNGAIVKDLVRVYRMNDIRAKFDLDADSLVLFALLSGGDYNTEGLRGCGPRTAWLVAKTEHGIAGLLRSSTVQDLHEWRLLLQEILREQGKSVLVPPTFPNVKALGHYCNPVVSALEALMNVRRLKDGWHRHIDQTKLRVFLRERFNIWTRGFIKHICPILLVQSLATASNEGFKQKNLALSIQMKRTRRKSTATEAPTNAEVKILFSPLSVLEIDISRAPPEEDWSVFNGKDGSAYDPTQSAETELLGCFLRRGLPATAWDEISLTRASGSDKRPNQKGSPSIPVATLRAAETASVTTSTGGLAKDSVAKVPKKQGRPRKETLTDPSGAHRPAKKGKVALPSREDTMKDVNTSERPRTRFKLPNSFLTHLSEGGEVVRQPASSHSSQTFEPSKTVIDVDAVSQPDEVPSSAPALRCDRADLSLFDDATSDSFLEASHFSSIAALTATPDQSARTIRQARLAFLNKVQGLGYHAESDMSPNLHKTPSRSLKREIIDLT